MPETSSGTRKRKCFNCDGEGHEAKNCPHPKADARGGPKAGARKGAHVVERGDGTYWAMVVRSKDEEGFQRVGQRPITVADFNIRYARGSQRQRRAQENHQTNTFGELGNVSDGEEVEPEVPSVPDMPEGAHRRKRVDKPRGKATKFANHSRCSCEEHGSGESCEVVQESADGLDKSSWPILSMPTGSPDVDVRTTDETGENPSNPDAPLRGSFVTSK